MGFTCAVPLCGNRSKPKSDKTRKYTFHAVPFTNPDRWQIWTRRCPYLQKYTLRQLESVRICNKHFLPHEIIEDVKFRRLSKDAIPSLYLPEMEAENILEIRPIKRDKPIRVKVVGLNLNFVSQDEMTEGVSKVPFYISKFKDMKCKFLTKKEMNKIRLKKKRNRLSFLRPDASRSNLPVDHQLYALPMSRRDSFLSVDQDLSTLPQRVKNTKLPVDHSLYTLPVPIEDSTLIDGNDSCTLPESIENIVECVTTDHSSENITISNDKPSTEMKIEPTDEYFITVTHDKEANEPNEILSNIECRDINYYLNQATEMDMNLYDLLTDPVHNKTTDAYGDIIKSISDEGDQHLNALPENELQQGRPLDEEILNLSLDNQAVILDNMENINNSLSDSNYSITLENDGDILHHFFNFDNKGKNCDSIFVNENDNQIKNEIMHSDLDNDNIQNMYCMLADGVNRMSPETDEGSTQHKAFVKNVDTSVSVPTYVHQKPLNTDNIKIEVDTQTENVENVCEVPTVIPDVISQTNNRELPSMFLTSNLFNLLTSKSPLEAQTIESLRALFSTIKEKHNVAVDSTPAKHSHVDKINLNENLNNITLIPSKQDIVTNVNVENSMTGPGQDDAILSTTVSTDEQRCTNREKLLSEKLIVCKKKLRCLKVRYERLKNDPVYTKRAKTFFQNYLNLSDDEKLLIDLQLRTVGKKVKGLRYTEEELRFACNLYRKSHESYRFLQQYLHLPKSKGTLHRALSAY